MEALVRRRLLVAVASVVLALGACGGDDTDPAGVIDDYVAAYNSGDIDAVMALFSEESVVTRHPFANRSEGLDAIRDLQVSDIGAAATSDAYTISNVEVSGDTVTWDHAWTNDEGSQFCQQGHSAVIQDGKFLTWAWPGSPAACP